MYVYKTTHYKTMYVYKTTNYKSINHTKDPEVSKQAP